MASISLYRKYRSQTFAEVVGQDHVTGTLAKAVTEGRLHHAYLFTGPRGTGKTSTARILAKSLNCEQGPTAEPCNTCVHCVGITAGSHVDVIEIDAASHGGVDDVRELRDRVAFSPAQARTKVYIVDECHMLSTAGWNAFLKTLEEPPGHVVFVFATTEPHKVLDTILSRTQRFDFRRMDHAALAGLATDLAGREGIDVEDGARDLIVQAADGSARDMLSLLDQVTAYTGTRVTVDAVAEVLGQIPADLLADAADCIAEGDVAGACALVGRVADAGLDLRQFARDAVDHLRSLFLLQVAPDAGLVDVSGERSARLAEQAGRMGRAELLRAMELLSQAQAQMRRGATRLALEIALAKAAMPEVSGDPAALAARLDRLERHGAGTAPVAGAAGESARDPDARSASAPGQAQAAPASSSSAAPPAGQPGGSAEEAAPSGGGRETAARDDEAPAGRSGEPRGGHETAARDDEAPAGPSEEPAGDASPPDDRGGDGPEAAESAGAGAATSTAAQTAEPDDAPAADPAASADDPRADAAGRADGPGAASAAGAAPAPAAAGAVDVAHVERSWQAVLDAVREQRVQSHAFLLMSRPVAVDGGVLTLEFRAGYGLHADRCGKSPDRDVIIAALERVLGARLDVRCVVGAQPAPSGQPGGTSQDGAAPDPPEPSPAVEDEAAAVAEREAAEADGDEEDADAQHDAAIERLRSELGATVVEDERP